MYHCKIITDFQVLKTHWYTLKRLHFCLLFLIIEMTAVYMPTETLMSDLRF